MIQSLSDPIIISIIVPTRARPERLRAMLDSLKAMTRRPERLEVVLVTDSDDRSYDDLNEEDLALRRVVVAPGLEMGELNRAGYAASTGEYVMLLNDDVVVRTQGWDDHILDAFRSIDDGIVLVHVNDRLFEEKLCTFPFLTRIFCEKVGGICPGGFRRYRIDDHIYNIFNLLNVLGHNRILYLRDVVFEHHNFVRTATGAIEYRPDEAIHARDTELFDALLAERKALAVALAHFIDERRSREIDTIRKHLLEPITDSVSLRKGEYVRWWLSDRSVESANTRVTIGIISADLRAPHAQACIAAVKKYTRNFDLVILDNNRGPNFNHSREMNRVFSACRTDFLVLMDDDVIVEAGWLDGLLRCVTPRVGVVTPLHKSRDGVLSYAGVVMSPDYSGHHSHAFHVPEAAFPIETLCSAIMLIDMGKCGHLRVDESYAKYFLDIDYGLRVWESGFEVVCSPHTLVTHLGGATLTQGSALSNRLFEEQRQHFLNSWVRTGRYQALEQSSLWREQPAIAEFLDVPRRLAALINTTADRSKQRFLDDLGRFFDWLRYYPALLQWVEREISGSLAAQPLSFVDGKAWPLAGLAGYTGYPVLIEVNFRGLNIILWKGAYYAIPPQEGPFVPQHAEKGAYGRYFKAQDLILLKTLIDAKITESDNPIPEDSPVATRRTMGSIVIALLTPHRVANFVRRKLKGARRRIASALRRRIIHHLPLPGSAASSSLTKRVDDRDSRRWVASSPVVQVVKDYQGRAIYRYEFKYFAVPAGSGAFDYQKFRAGAYGKCPTGYSIPEVKSLIDREGVISAGTEQSLVFGCAPPERLAALLAGTPPNSTKILWPNSQPDPVPGFAVVKAGPGDIAAWAKNVVGGGGLDLLQKLAEDHYGKVVIPWSFPETWRDSSLEVAASKIADHVQIVYATGERRDYSGENLHRLIYNKAYLASMFKDVPEPCGSTVLEVGCSDGMICDIFALMGAGKVVGIDVMETVGCSFPHTAVEYRTMEATKLDFPDRSFDIVYSIATLEHVPNPAAVLAEIVRVLKVGGYAYVQAAPLYHSPFGHHMFAYFQDYPWIHLRKTKNEIITYGREKCIAGAVKRDYGISFETYLDEMLNFDHVNGLFLDEFDLEQFRRRNDIEILKLNKTFEGDDLLTSDIQRELAHIGARRLVEHGFELTIRRIA